MGLEENNGFQHPKPAITLSGTASKGVIAPPLGLIDIGISESSYIFRVALPGVRNSKDNLKCQIQIDGRVNIEGVISESEFLRTSSQVYRLKVQQLPPPGPFTVSFNLLGAATHSYVLHISDQMELWR